MSRAAKTVLLVLGLIAYALLGAFAFVQAEFADLRHTHVRGPECCWVVTTDGPLYARYVPIVFLIGLAVIVIAGIRWVNRPKISN